MQEHWDSFIPQTSRPAPGSIKTVALSFLMDPLGLGGGRWIRQFAHGFDVAGTFSQRLVFPRNFKIHPPLDTDIFGCDRAARFSTRARASGFPHAGHLWAEAKDQVSCGWLPAPPFLATRTVTWLGRLSTRPTWLSAFPSFRDRRFGPVAISRTA